MSKLHFLFMILMIQFTISQNCNKISVSSNSLQYENDMVKNGIINEKWTENSNTPIIIDNEKRVDYIYVNIIDNPEKLNVNTFVTPE